MRGKLAPRPETADRPNAPSMRPAHYAREVARSAQAPAAARSPSMRPAHYAREVADKVYGFRVRGVLQ